jgi:hypothetical protein
VKREREVRKPLRRPGRWTSLGLGISGVMETSREVLTARFLSRPIAFSSLEEMGEKVEVERDHGEPVVEVDEGEEGLQE